MSKTFTKDDVASHSKTDNLWVVIDEDVYDLTGFQDEHPGKFELTVAPKALCTMLTSVCDNQVERRVCDRIRNLRRNSATNHTTVVLQRVAGKDASKQFWKYHNEGILKKYKGKLQIGSLDSKKAAASEPAASSAPAKAQASKPVAAPVDVASAKSSETQDPYGDLVPFADPSWYQGVSLPRWDFWLASVSRECENTGLTIS